MARNLKLLLTENVESLGIVGDVVNVRTGYARNFLMPRNLATQPSDEKIKALSAKRAEAEKMLAQQRKEREALAGKLQGVEVTLIRSCNDQGILYASVTQQDLATALNAMGHAVKPRDVRINQVMKRVDNFDVHIKLDSDLDSIVKVHVQADRKLDLARHDEPAHAEDRAPAEAGTGEAEAADRKPAKGEKPAKGDKADDQGEKPKATKREKSAEGADKPAKREKSHKAEPAEAPSGKGTFGKPKAEPGFFDKPMRSESKSKGGGKPKH